MSGVPFSPALRNALAAVASATGSSALSPDLLEEMRGALRSLSTVEERRVAIERIGWKAIERAQRSMATC